jgi:hypothetical protein
MRLESSKGRWFSSWILALLVGVGFFASPAHGQRVKPDAGTVFVNTALGGFILGYDIDQSGTEGILAEALTLNDGRHTVAVETFDQRTGKILKILAQQTDSNNDFVALGVYGNGVGLIEFEKVSGHIVSQRLYGTVNPLKSNHLSGTWTPPLTTNQFILAMGASQGASNTAVLAAQGFNSLVFGSDVAANTFGPVFTLNDTIFGFNDSPVMAIDTQANQAVVVASDGGILSNPQLAEVDLATGNTVQFRGLGFGSVNGIAVDSTKHLACTTSEVDFSLELYDLTNQFSILVQPLEGATNQSQAGGAVAFDPIHGLFLIGQEFSSVAPSGSSILIYDERGDFIKSVDGLSLPASPVNIAINPTQRIGYVLVTPALTQLQGFKY